MVSYRYSAWGGGAEGSALSSHELMDELSDYLLSQGDVESALRQMMQKGMKNQQQPGLQDMLQQLRQKRQEALDKHQLSSMVDDLKEKLQSVVDAERQGIQDRLAQARDRAHRAEQALAEREQTAADRGDQQPTRQAEDEDARARNDAEEAARHEQFMEALAQEKNDFLDRLPNDMGHAVSALSNYDFTSPAAKQMFDQLMQELRDQVNKQMQQQLGQQNQQGGAESTAQQMKNMLEELTQMLQQRMQGMDTQEQWDKFQERHQPQMGQQGGGQQSMDDFMQQMQQHARMMQSMMESLQGDNRHQMEDLLQAMMADMDLQEAMQELQQAMQSMFPQERPQRYSFRGDEHVNLSEAMDLMQQLSELEDLERQLRKAQYGDGINDIDADAVRELLGEEAANALEMLKTLAEELKQAGYLRQNGDKLELTPLGMRKIGQKALRDIFDRLKEGRMGRHASEQRGVGIERVDETKGYEFGDPFYLDLQQTVRNALQRGGAEGRGVKLAPDDFEVYRTELQTECTTVLMLDLSWSMARRGSFYAAKKVILALHNLIKTQFPRDSIYIVGFSTYARELKPDQLPYITWDQAEPYTNMQQGLIISQKLLARHKSGTKQILMISDGEPTAHIERGQVFLGYPPSPRTISETLREVRHCTKDNILINVFMLDRSYYLREFVDQLTKINRGRAFYTSPDNLGQYVMVDYLRNRRSRIA